MSPQMLTELLRGQGAHADPLACVQDLPAELAARQVAGFPHSVAQLVFHMNYWMDYDLRRVRGEKPPYPTHNSGSFPATEPVSIRMEGIARTICRTSQPDRQGLQIQIKSILIVTLKPLTPVTRNVRIRSKQFCGSSSRTTAIMSAKLQ